MSWYRPTAIYISVACAGPVFASWSSFKLGISKLNIEHQVRSLLAAEQEQHNRAQERQAQLAEWFEQDVNNHIWLQNATTHATISDEESDEPEASVQFRLRV